MDERSAPCKALVLAGGGARGSYQVGVWRALMELDWHPQIITGTSVGSLNGAMFVLDQYETARDMWLAIRSKDVMELPEEDADLSALHQFLRSVVKAGGMDVTPLEEIVERGHVHAAVPHHFPQESVQLREVGVFLRQLHHVLAADAHPHVPGRFVQVQRKHGTVQAAHTGAGDDLGPPAQLGQGTPHTHLIAAARTAACQHQCLDRGIILCHLERLLVIFGNLSEVYHIFRKNSPCFWNKIHGIILLTCVKRWWR